jgi:branched-chain amino acid aminotransferase
MKKVEIHVDAVERVKRYTINDHELGFGKHIAPIMLQGLFDQGEWTRFDLLPYGPLQLDPCTKVLHYAQEIFEGMKVFKQPDGSIKMFRPHLNAIRFNNSARRMAMPEIPVEQFLRCCEIFSSYCKDLVPKRLGESLYLRPFMIASEVGLGIKPAKQFLFIIVGSPSGAYFNGSSVKVYIERDDIRCAPRGMGFAKTGGNYAASLNSYDRTLKLGCDQTMWLDSLENKYIEEMSGMNFFAVIEGALYTPPLSDTILDGITRKSIIELATKEKISVTEKRIPIDELLKAIESGKCTEAFVCGTASIIVPIASFTDKDHSVHHLSEPQGNLSMRLREKLLNIQGGKSQDFSEWMHLVPEVHF